MDPISRLMKKARAVVLRRGAPFDDAEDIVQEAFARLDAYTRTHEIKSEEAFLINAAVNISRDQARRRRNAPFSDSAVQIDLVADSAPPADEVLRAQERLRRLTAGMAQLNPRAHRCLIAKRLEGRTYAQIAEQEGISVSAAEKAVARAIVFLTKWMDGW